MKINSVQVQPRSIVGMPMTQGAQECIRDLSHGSKYKDFVQVLRPGDYTTPKGVALKYIMPFRTKDGKDKLEIELAGCFAGKKSRCADAMDILPEYSDSKKYLAAVTDKVHEISEMVVRKAMLGLAQKGKLAKNAREILAQNGDDTFIRKTMLEYFPLDKQVRNLGFMASLKNFFNAVINLRK